MKQLCDIQEYHLIFFIIRRLGNFDGDFGRHDAVPLVNGEYVGTSVGAVLESTQGVFEGRVFCIVPSSYVRHWQQSSRELRTSKLTPFGLRD